MSKEFQDNKNNENKKDNDKNKNIDYFRHKEYKCSRCDMKFTEYLSYEKHCWRVHPCNKYEKAWANTDWSKWTGSTYYRDNPYY